MSLFQIKALLLGGLFLALLNWGLYEIFIEHHEVKEESQIVPAKEVHYTKMTLQIEEEQRVNSIKLNQENKKVVLEKKQAVELIRSPEVVAAKINKTQKEIRPLHWVDKTKDEINKIDQFSIDSLNTLPAWVQGNERLKAWTVFYYSEWAKADPQSAWNSLDQLPPDQKALARIALIQSWVKESPNEAMQWVEAINHGSQRLELLSEAFRVWIKQDIQAALTWTEQLPNRDRDRVISDQSSSLLKEHRYLGYRAISSLSESSAKLTAIQTAMPTLHRHESSFLLPIIGQLDQEHRAEAASSLMRGRNIPMASRAPSRVESKEVEDIKDREEPVPHKLAFGLGHFLMDPIQRTELVLETEPSIPVLVETLLK